MEPEDECCPNGCKCLNQQIEFLVNHTKNEIKIGFSTEAKVTELMKMVNCLDEFKLKLVLTYDSMQLEGTDGLNDFKTIIRRLKRFRKGGRNIRFGQVKTYCVKCGKFLEKVKKCSRCKIAFYCSRECQKEDWSEHKKHCKT